MSVDMRGKNSKGQFIPVERTGLAQSEDFYPQASAQAVGGHQAIVELRPELVLKVHGPEADSAREPEIDPAPRRNH
jgi:hypothetical protein